MEELQQTNIFLPAIKKMRLLLMIGSILYTYKVYSGSGDLSGVVFGFVFPALYIISGYLVLREDQDVGGCILRAIKRTAICFGILAVSYFGLSLAFEPAFTLAMVSNKAFWAEFLVFNVWPLPIGSVIWFVQALLYAYIIIYFINKLKLLRFDIIIAALCLVVTVLTGELSSVVGFHLLWHTYLGGNFLTRALPYILIGSFLSRKEEYIADRLDLVKHIIVLASGIILTAGEYYALTVTGSKVYTGHLIGMGVVAVAVSMCGIFWTDMEIRFIPLDVLSRYEICIPFFISSPIYYLLGRLAQTDIGFFQLLGRFPGVVVLILSFALFSLYVFIRYTIMDIKYGDEDTPDNENTDGT